MQYIVQCHVCAWGDRAGTVRDCGEQVDVSINNPLGMYNTQLLRSYAQVDPRVRQLGVLVKKWAKARKINCSRDGTLTSYGMPAKEMLLL